MARLINYFELKQRILEERDKIPLTLPGAYYEFGIAKPNHHGNSMRGGIRKALRCLEQCQSVDAVSRGVHDQVRWERDIAMEQLEEHGIPFGGIAPDVVKVVRCKDCVEGIRIAKCDYDYVVCRRSGLLNTPNDFCSYGERRTK